MIQEHIERIRTKVQDTESLPAETKTELLELLSLLKTEVGELSQTREADAQTVARSVDASAQEAIRPDRQPEEFDTALGELNASVEGLEATHPKLVETVNRIAVTLSNMGI